MSSIMTMSTNLSHSQTSADTWTHSVTWGVGDLDCHPGNMGPFGKFGGGISPPSTPLNLPLTARLPSGPFGPARGRQSQEDSAQIQSCSPCMTSPWCTRMSLIWLVAYLLLKLFGLPTKTKDCMSLGSRYPRFNHYSM